MFLAYLFSTKKPKNMRTKLEYIWLDGYAPTQNMRSKTKVVEGFDGKLESCPMWAFDGSSTRQAEGDSSDCLLKPVAIYPDPARNNGYLVMTEVLNSDGTPHVSNGRALIDDDDNDFWFGFEQEYFIMDSQTLLHGGILKKLILVLFGSGKLSSVYLSGILKIISLLPCNLFVTGDVILIFLFSLFPPNIYDARNLK